ncbi:MAG: DegT/DnrJ/EryC1/StrS family aminotransferase, partial [Deltaproteobacteria bacterium]|nr:DegT/DnrJ/EryC1/StrS family aminotransferase [Deltaproteobacteria bacterium]
YDIPLIEDAADALGSKYKGKHPGTFGLAGFYSFNGNKIITTSGGGILVSNDLKLINKVKFWSTQARNNAAHYEHTEMGYNYRMSNVLAAIGRGQLKVLADRVAQKREIFSRYQQSLCDLPGVSFMPEPDFAASCRWLTCLTVDPDKTTTDRDAIIRELERHNIESRPTWKPMHMQPLYKKYPIAGGSVAEHLFKYGLCLPSGTGMTLEEQEYVIAVLQDCWN